MDELLPKKTSELPSHHLKAISKKRKANDTLRSEHRTKINVSNDLSLPSNNEDSSDDLSDDDSSNCSSILNSSSESEDGHDDDQVFFQSPKLALEREIEFLTSIPSIKMEFIHSLLDGVPDSLRDHEALNFRVNFKYRRDQLARRIFEILNKEVFMYKLPANTDIIMNKKMLRTAGYCRYRHRINERGHREMYIQIDIAVKVCDNAQKLLEVMIHEMCHGGVFIVNKAHDIHGPIWKSWCFAAHKAFPLVTLSTRCHNYKIRTKHEYRCVRCPYIIKKHSKAKDHSKKPCRVCGGELALYTDGGYGKHLKVDGNEPINPFAQFVRDKYKLYRPEAANHKEVMTILSKEYQKEKNAEANELRETLRNTLNE